MSTREFKNSTEYLCSICGIDTWLGKKITLEIDHIDGNNKNNDSKNLRYLCPNCHSQTPTWRGKNKNTGYKVVTNDELIDAIKESDNIRQALITVGLTPKGKNYSRVSKLMNTRQVDTKNSQYGTVWVNDGSRNKKIKKELLEDYISCGYIRGRLTNNLTSPPSQKGKVWITNGIKNKMAYPENIPEGYWRGKVQRKD